VGGRDNEMKTRARTREKERTSNLLEQARLHAITSPARRRIGKEEEGERGGTIEQTDFEAVGNSARYCYRERDKSRLKETTRRPGVARAYL